MDLSHYSITECKALILKPLFFPPRKALHEADIDVAALINEADTWIGLYVTGMNSVTHVMLECFTKKPQTTGWLCTS